MDTAKQIQVIETTLKRKGDGKTNPFRVITQYWSMEGELLAEVDPLNPAEESLRKIAEFLDQAKKDKMDIGYDSSMIQLLRKIAGMDYCA